MDEEDILDMELGPTDTGGFEPQGQEELIEVSQPPTAPEATGGDDTSGSYDPGIVPEQILHLLAGSDVLFMPPRKEGTKPTPAELFFEEHADALRALGVLDYVRQGQDTDDPEDDAILFFNSRVFGDDIDTLEGLAREGRLAEYMHGWGNGSKPESPTHMVRVRAANGQSIRDILTADEESAKRAAARQNPSYVTEILPYDANVGQQALNERPN